MKGESLQTYKEKMEEYFEIEEEIKNLRSQVSEAYRKINRLEKEQCQRKRELRKE